MSSTKDVDNLIKKELTDIYPEVRQSTDRDIRPTAPPMEVEAFPTIEVNGYSVTADQYKEHNRVWIYIAIAVILILFLVVVWVLIYRYYDTDTSTTSTETEPDEEDINYGAMVNAKDYFILTSRTDRRMKNEYQMLSLPGDKCGYGRYGPWCRLQGHDPRYYIIGNFDAEFTTKELTGKKPLSLDYKLKGGKFFKNSCTSICNMRSDCRGVVYDNDNETCSLITSDIIAKGNSSLNFASTKQTYLKRANRPHFIDKVIGFSGSRPQRYYIDRENKSPILNKRHTIGTTNKVKPGVVVFTINHVIKTTWIPYRISNYGGFVGLWSTNKFTFENWHETPMDFTDNGRSEYNLPFNLQDYDQMFVLYITLDEYNKRKQS